MDNTSNREFDRQIRRALSNKTVPYDSSSWKMLEERMAAIRASDSPENFDSSIKEALKNYEAPYMPGSWQLLNERLERGALRRDMWIMKAMEAAVVVLVIMTLVRFTGGIPEIRELILLPRAEKSIRKEAPHPTMSQVAEAQAAIDGGRLTLPQVDQAPASGLQTPPPLTIDHVGTDYLLEESSAKAVVAPPVTLRNANHRPVADVTRRAFSPVTSAQTELMAGIMRDKGHTALPQALAANAFEPVISASAQDLFAFDVADFSSQSQRVTTNLTISYINSINSISSQDLYDRSNVTETRVSPGLGMAANVAFGNFGFDVGLAYDKLAYGRGSRMNALHRVQLPIHLRYRMVDRSYLEVHAKAGASVHAITHAYYDPGVQASRSLAEEQPRFNGGLMGAERSYAAENMFYSMNFGLSTRVPVSDRLAISVESTYMHRLKNRGVGPSSDRINSMYTTVGISVALDKVTW